MGGSGVELLMAGKIVGKWKRVGEYVYRDWGKSWKKLEQVGNYELKHAIGLAKILLKAREGIV